MRLRAACGSVVTVVCYATGNALLETHCAHVAQTPDPSTHFWREDRFPCMFLHASPCIPTPACLSNGLKQCLMFNTHLFIQLLDLLQQLRRHQLHPMTAWQLQLSKVSYDAAALIADSLHGALVNQQGCGAAASEPWAQLVVNLP